VGKFDPIYASIDALLHRRVLGVVIIANSAWWVELMDDGRQPYSNTAFRIWEAVLHWVAVVMPAFLRTLKLKSTLPAIAFNLEIPWDDLERERVLTDEDIAHCIEVAPDPERKRVNLMLRSDWHWALRRTDNTAEILLATQLLVGAARLYGTDRSQGELATLVREAAGSPDLRWIHSFEARTALEGLEAKDLIKSFYPIPKSAVGLAKCRAVWNTRPRQLGNRIVGKKSCAELLTDHNRNLLTRLRAEVRQCDRKALVMMALEDLQAALNEQRHWRLTARALRAVHGVEGDFEASLLRAGQANAVIRAATILAEVATVEAPEQGGARVGRMDMEELEARAVMVFAAGDLLAAVYGDRTEPTFNISPTGDLLYDHRFEELTIQRAAEVRHESDRQRAAQQYGEHFEAQALSPSMEAKLQAAISAEYGVDYDAFVQAPSAALQLGIQMGIGVISLRRSELIELLEGMEMIAGKELAPMIDRMTMSARAGWDDLPAGGNTNDFDLAKFDRRFSLMARPIIALSGKSDPELVFAPALIERAMIHNMAGALTGTLQNDFWQSDAMRRFASSAGSKAGIAFNGRVAEALKILQLRTWSSAAPAWCLNQRATEELKALGDIDVLAVGPGGSCVWIVEAKDLKLCRTLGEAARRLSEYRGKLTQKGKPDKLLRHLQRVSYIRKNASALCNRLALSAAPKVCGLVIVNAPQPMEQITSDAGADGTFVMLSDIGKVPWATGWPTKT
jgi:hypothetical protein